MVIEQKLMTSRYEKLVKILGKQYVKSKVESPFDFIQIAGKGIDAGIINNFRNYFNLPGEATAHILNTSAPTMYRWISSNKKLDRNYSVKLFEVTELFLYGTEVFESQDNFFKWLSLPNTALGGMEPQELLEISGGVSKVMDVLGRIEHGVYS